MPTRAGAAQETVCRDEQAVRLLQMQEQGRTCQDQLSKVDQQLRVRGETLRHKEAAYQQRDHELRQAEMVCRQERQELQRLHLELEGASRKLQDKERAVCISEENAKCNVEMLKRQADALGRREERRAQPPAAPRLLARTVPA